MPHAHRDLPLSSIILKAIRFPAVARLLSTCRQINSMFRLKQARVASEAMQMRIIDTYFESMANREISRLPYLLGARDLSESESMPCGVNVGRPGRVVYGHRGLLRGHAGRL